MNRIQLLDEATANRIAAGEVVERPASVIKELCENSLDAGATALSIAIEAGGMKHIVISDNGSGIHPDDVPLAFQRHATGKIRSGDSLSAIETLGFRGEALSSIAAVSRLRIRTRIHGNDMGREMEIHGGQVVYDGECGCPEGTYLDVRDLFYNTPARLKFIKSSAPEAAAVSDTILRLIIANPDISIKFNNNGKLVYHSPGSGLLDAIRAIYGKDISDNVIPIQSNTSGIEVYGYIGKPDISRKSRAGQSLIVNGRYVRSNAISEAIKEGYSQKLMIGRFPFFALHVNVPYGMIDVNVHPQKLEIRISNEEALCRLMENVVRDTLAGTSDIRHMSIPERIVNQPATIEHIEEQQAFYTTPTEAQPSKLEQSLDTIKQEMGYLYEIEQAQNAKVSEPSGLLNEIYDNNIVTESNDEAAETVLNDDAVDVPELGESPILIGQAFSTFAIVQYGEKLMIIDQHAAHERLTYERYRKQLEGAGVASQEMLTPTVLKLTYAEHQIFSDYKEHFRRLGFDIDEFGGSDVAVRAVPIVLGEPAIQGMINDILDDLAADKTPAIGDMVDDRIIMSACKHSVKAGDTLQRKELEVVVAMLNSNSALTCPHGRPIAMYLTRKDLEKGFKRLV